MEVIQPVEVIRPVLVERVKDRIADQMVDVPVLPATEEIAAAVNEGGEVGPTGRKSVPQEQFSERVCDQIVDVSVLQFDVQENTNAAEARLFQVRAISNEIQVKYSSNEDLTLETLVGNAAG